MAFNFLWDRTYDGPIHHLGRAIGHHCFLYFDGENEFRARCECDATWTYGEKSTMELMLSIYESHLKYFNRPKLETL